MPRPALTPPDYLDYVVILIPGLSQAWPRRALPQVRDRLFEPAPVVTAVDLNNKVARVAVDRAHAGMVNTLDYARRKVRPAPILAAVGGFHLLAATDSSLDWTAAKLREAGLRYLLGAHCTGIEAVYRLRNLLGLPRETAVVGAVGSSFTVGKGIDALALARCADATAHPLSTRLTLSLRPRLPRPILPPLSPASRRLYRRQVKTKPQ